jgi:hypothetical protein
MSIGIIVKDPARPSREGALIVTGSLIALILAADVIVGWLLADAVARRADRDIARQARCAPRARVLTEVDAGLSPAFMVAGDDGGDVGRLDAVEVQM